MDFACFPIYGIIQTTFVCSRIVTAKILRLRFTQKLNNHRGSDVRGDRQFELSLLND